MVIPLYVKQALQAGAALSLAHLLNIAIVMHYDLSGKWAKYSMNKQRNVTAQDYFNGIRSFLGDMIFLFIPCITFCFWCRSEQVAHSKDTVLESIAKLFAGYFLGKVWSFFIHYALHFPWLYQFHRKHHGTPRKVHAALAWTDSFVEYSLMELPSFFITVMLFPTHLIVHLLHFAYHGWDGGASHSGFAGAPGIMGWLYDSEYHYYHHSHLTVNYGEMEIIDLLFGTHHTQRSEEYKKKLRTDQSTF